MFSPSDNSDTSEDTPPSPGATPTDAQVYLEEDEEEDFQTVPLDDKHWTTRGSAWQNTMHTWNMPYHMDYACIHGHYANYLLPSYTDTMDLSDILEFWRHHDNVQWWGYTSTQGCSILKKTGLHWTFMFTLIYSIN